VIGSAGFVFGADVEREITGLAAVDEQVLDGVEISLGRAVLLEDVTPTAGADLEIEVPRICSIWRQNSSTCSRYAAAPAALGRPLPRLGITTMARSRPRPDRRTSPSNLAPYREGSSTPKFDAL
jgi:hypothetical protein